VCQEINMVYLPVIVTGLSEILSLPGMGRCSFVVKSLTLKSYRYFWSINAPPMMEMAGRDVISPSQTYNRGYHTTVPTPNSGTDGPQLSLHLTHGFDIGKICQHAWSCAEAPYICGG
jgi:hypothetical protein